MSELEWVGCCEKYGLQFEHSEITADGIVCLTCKDMCSLHYSKRYIQPLHQKRHNGNNILVERITFNE